MDYSRLFDEFQNSRNNSGFSEFITCFPKSKVDEMKKYCDLTFFEFHNWILSKNIDTIMNSDLTAYINEFAEKYDYSKDNSEIELFKNKYLKITNKRLIDKILISIGLKSNFFIQCKRYSKIKFHGIFLFTIAEKKKLKSFMSEYKKDINQLSENYLDIYFNKLELRNANGQKTLNELNINQTFIMPMFLLWDNELGINKSIGFTLETYNKLYMYKLITLIINEIKDHRIITEIENNVKKNFENKAILYSYSKMENNFSNCLIVDNSFVENH